MLSTHNTFAIDVLGTPDLNFLSSILYLHLLLTLELSSVLLSIGRDIRQIAYLQRHYC